VIIMRVLAGIDLNTKVYGWLVAQAAFFASYMDAKVDLYFVLAPYQETQRAQFTAELEQVLQGLPEAQRGCAIIESGNPVEALVHKAEEYDALVVGPREPGALEALLFGSIASRVVKKSQCAVFTPRLMEHREDASNKVLLAVDVNNPCATPYGEQVRPWLARMKATADILYADPQALPHISNAQVRERATREWQASRKEDMEKLDNFLTTYVPEHSVGVIRLEQGDPSDVLVRVSKDYDLIIVGSRPRPGLSGVVFGSVAAQLVREASCDILTLPTSQE
jgi:nucleotide-binding universal stress UspA family protein